MVCVYLKWKTNFYIFFFYYFWIKDCEGYLVKLYLMYQCLESMEDNKGLSELKPILSKHHEKV